MKKFGHLNVPSHWEHYWSKYPEGYTILEALLNWVAQVDSMVDNVNDWNVYLDRFVERFDERLQDEVREKMLEWLKDGTLETLVNESLFGFPLNIYHFKEDVTTDSRGRDDWSEALRSALSLSNNIVIPPIDNLYMKDVYIPSGTTIHGYKGQTVIKGFFHDDIGNYTDTIFHVDNVDNVVINNITFDGDLTYTAYVVTGDRTRVKNLISVNQSREVEFSGCRFTNFVSNVLDSEFRKGWEGHLWAIMVIKHSENVYLLDCKLDNARLEGITGYDTKNFHVENLYSENTNLSTPLHAWFCDGFKLINSTIYEDVNRGRNAGSTLNIYSKNVLMTGNIITGGTSIDIGNEAEDGAFYGFVAENIIMSDNIFNVGINGIGSTDGFQMVKNVQITNNTFNTDGYTRAINTGNSEDVLIDNNYFNGEAGIRYSLNSINGLKITNNTFKNSLISVGIVPAGKDVRNVTISGNTSDATTAFVDFPYSDKNTSLERVENIIIENNRVKTDGAWFRVSTPTGAMYRMNNVRLINNEFLPISETVETGLYMIYMNDVLIENNRIDGMTGSISFSQCDDIRVKGNTFYSKATSVLPNSLLHFRETCGGLVEVTDNEVAEGLENVNTIGGLNYNSNVTNTRAKNNIPDSYANGLRASHFGLTSNRPIKDLHIGYRYFDTTLGLPIHWNGTEWIDSTGTTV